MPRLILASSSPRRLEILRSLGIAPLVRPSHVPEVRRGGETPAAFVERLARDKVTAALATLTRERSLIEPTHLHNILVLGADTVVALDDEVFGKPRDAEDAARMLARLSGRAHDVYTGLAIGTGDGGRVEQGIERTRVRFAPISAEEVQAYVGTGEPLDKAGGYGIQAGAKRFVERIEGSYSNVVGLPVELMVTLLARLGQSIASLGEESASGGQ